MKEFRKSRISLTSGSSGSCSPHESLVDVNSAASKASICEQFSVQIYTFSNFMAFDLLLVMIIITIFMQ